MAEHALLSLGQACPFPFARAGMAIETSHPVLHVQPMVKGHGLRIHYAR